MVNVILVRGVEPLPRRGAAHEGPDRVHQRDAENEHRDQQRREEKTDREDLLSQLDSLEEKVVRMKLPASFQPLVYDLRLHIGMVRERLERS